MDTAQSQSSVAPPKNRQIKNFLIDRKFQMGWVLRVALAAAVVVRRLVVGVLVALSLDLRHKLGDPSGARILLEARYVLLPHADRSMKTIFSNLKESLMDLMEMLTDLMTFLIHLMNLKNAELDLENNLNIK